MKDCLIIGNKNAVTDKEPLVLTARYSPEKYPKYDDYDAVECGKSRKIPKDYYGVIGVPITFFRLWNPQQFEIIDLTTPVIGNKHYYERLLIKRRGQ